MSIIYIFPGPLEKDRNLINASKKNNQAKTSVSNRDSFRQLSYIAPRVAYILANPLVELLQAIIPTYTRENFSISRRGTREVRAPYPLPLFLCFFLFSFLSASFSPSALYFTSYTRHFAAAIYHRLSFQILYLRERSIHALYISVYLTSRLSRFPPRAFLFSAFKFVLFIFLCVTDCSPAVSDSQFMVLRSSRSLFLDFRMRHIMCIYIAIYLQRGITRRIDFSHSLYEPFP